jgi:ComF family protein
MKFKNQPKLAQTIGSLVCEEMLKHGPLPDFDYIVPVPMHPKKKRQRGYNQAELVAKEAARILEKEIRTDILLKIQNTKPQILLKREERLRNLEGAFKVNDNNIIEKNHNKHILLVDDVLTTGTTINTCAKILKDNGFSFVYALVIAMAEK